MCMSAACAQILIGQTTGVTGPVAASVGETITGAQLVIDDANARGGINGQPIEILRMDDKFDPKLSAENARALIEDKHVIGLFMSRGTPHTQAIIPLLNQYGVPMVGPSTGAMVLEKPLQKYVFNVRATYQREAALAIQQLATMTLKRIAVVYSDDSFGADVLEGTRTGFSLAKLQPTATVPMNRGKPDYADIIPKVAGAQAVLWSGSAEAVADGIRALRAAGSAAQVVTLSNNASAGFIKLLGTAATGVIVTQVFPDERTMSVPMITEAHQLLRAKDAKAVLTPAMLEGYASAKVLVEALRRAGPDPTRAKLQAALENLHDYDLGGLHVNFSPKLHAGIDFAELSMISGGRFIR